MPEGFLYYICPVWGMSRKWRQIEGSKWHFSGLERPRVVHPAPLRDFPHPKGERNIQNSSVFARGAWTKGVRSIIILYKRRILGGAWAFALLRGQKSGKFVRKTCNDKQICAFCKTKLLDYVYQRRILWNCRTHWFPCGKRRG